MSSYIMDTALEGARIEHKTDSELTREQLCWAGLRGGAVALDLGCAAGTTSRLMASLVGREGRVVGVDASDGRIAEARAHAGEALQIEYRVGDAAAIPLGDDEVDLAWSRFLFEYLQEPAAALGEMVRVTRPGGAVAVSDLDGNCIWHSPADAALEAELAAAMATFGRGFDPWAGRRLFGMLVRAGLREVAVDVRPYHIIAGAVEEVALEHWQMKLRGVSAALAARGWSEARAAALAARFENYLLDPHTMTYSVLFTVRGRVE